MLRTLMVLCCITALVLGVFGLAVAERTGQAVYESKCKMCHGTGVAGAPKLGDKIWLEHEKNHGGVTGMLEIAFKGKNAMPPRGACGDCTDGELKAAIQYMLDSAK